MSDETPPPEGDPASGPYVPPPEPPGGGSLPPMPAPQAGGGPTPPPYGQPAYGQPSYGQGAYGYGPPPVARNGFGVTALVLGILGLVTSWFVVGIVPGVLAVVFGALGRGRARRGEATNGGSAVAGLILGVLAVVIAIVFIFVGIYLRNHCVNVHGKLHCNDPNYPVH